MSMLNAQSVRRLNYPSFIESLSEVIRNNALAAVEKSWLEIALMDKAHIRKEGVVTKVLTQRSNHAGLVHIILAMKECKSYRPRTTLRYCLLPPLAHSHNAISFQRWHRSVYTFCYQLPMEPLQYQNTDPWPAIGAESESTESSTRLVHKKQPTDDEYRKKQCLQNHRSYRCGSDSRQRLQRRAYAKRGYRRDQAATG